METIKKLQAYMGNRKILVPLSLIISGINAFVSLLPFVFIWLIINTLLKSRGVSEGTAINLYAWWALATAVLGVILYFLSLMMSHLAAFRAEINMRRIAMQKILKMPLGFFSKNTVGRMRKIIDEDSSNTHSFIAHILPDLAGSVVLPLAVIVLVFAFDWRLGIACAIPLLSAFILLGYLMSPKNSGFQKMYLDAQEQMGSEAVEYVRGIPVVKVFQQTIFSFKKFYESIITYKELIIKHTLIWKTPFSLYIAIIHSFTFFIVPASILIISNSGNYVKTIADMFLYVLITPFIGSSIFKIMHLSQNIFLANEAVTRLENLTESTVLSTPDNPKYIKNHQINFDNVVFRYPEAKQNVIDGISVHIPQGKTYALVGQSGSGKTTIARLIPRFWDVKQGSVKIGGVNVKNISKEDLMNNVSFVFQNTKLFKISILDNIKYGNPNATERQVQQAIELSQSSEIINRLPNGLQTKIGANGTYLSGGEQQRIVLARAFLKDAPIVVLDEATAFADPENEHLIQKALQELMKGKTVLMIAHRLTSVQNADKILVIEKGKIAEQGTHNELINQKNIYYKMWNEYQKSVLWTV